MLRGYASPFGGPAACSGRTVTRNEAPSVVTAVALQPMMTTTDLSRGTTSCDQPQRHLPSNAGPPPAASWRTFCTALRRSSSDQQLREAPRRFTFRASEANKKQKRCVDGGLGLALISPGRLWQSFHRLQRRPAWLQVCRHETAQSSSARSRC